MQDLAPKTLREALQLGVQHLRQSGVEHPRADAEHLLSAATGLTRAQLLAHPNAPLSPAAWETYRGWIERRAQGEPIAYLVGYTWFYDVRLHITPDVLIPRPETELLVERTLALLRPRGARVRLADVGTGSAAILVALGRHLPRARLWGTDISPRALRVARHNVRAHRLTDRCLLVQADVLAPLKGPFDVIVANLPYVGTGETAVVDPRVLEYEPPEALWAGPQGLDLIRRLVDQVPGRLVPGGYLLLEIGYRQEQAVRQLIRQRLPSSRVQVHRDLAGHPRVVEVRYEE